MKKILPIFFQLFLFLSCEQFTETADKNLETMSTQTLESLKTPDDCEIMKFRFLITQDYQASSVVRKVEIFLDKKAFSEENLRKLFSKVSKKHSEATFLIVVVNTDWEQLSMPIYPEDCPGVGSSGNGKPQMFEYHEARYYRRGENEFFTYNPTLGTADFKDVILKGGKIWRNGKWQEQ